MERVEEVLEALKLWAKYKDTPIEELEPHIADKMKKVKCALLQLKRTNLSPHDMRTMATEINSVMEWYRSSGMDITDLDSASGAEVAKFKKAKDLCKNFLKSSAAISKKDRSVAIAALGSKTGGGGGGNLNAKDAGMSVPLKCYKTAECKKLPDAQKLGLKIKRKRRKDNGGADESPTKKAKLSKASAKAIAAQIKALNVSDGNEGAENEGSDGKDSGKNSGAGNRDNPALKRKK